MGMKIVRIMKRSKLIFHKHKEDDKKKNFLTSHARTMIIIYDFSASNYFRCKPKVLKLKICNVHPVKKVERRKDFSNETRRFNAVRHNKPS